MVRDREKAEDTVWERHWGEDSLGAAGWSPRKQAGVQEALRLQ